MSSPQNQKGRSPKTELDEKFLSIARQIMKSHGINSDRAISLALGRKPDFINRVSNGVQSATPEAWDILFSKYPEARNITTTNVMAQGSGQVVGTVHGDNHYSPTTLQDCQQELVQAQQSLAAAQKENALLTNQLADKERTIQILLNQLPKP